SNDERTGKFGRTMREQRKQKREDLSIEARYHNVSGALLCGRVENISQGGIYILTDAPQPQGVFLSLSLDAPELGKVIDVWGTVVRSDAGRGMAIEFSLRKDYLLEELISLLVRVSKPGPRVTRQTPEGKASSGSRNQAALSMGNHESVHSGVGVKEKRRSTRRLLKIEARYQDTTGAVLKGIVRNISMGGVFIETSQPLAEGEFIHLSLDAVDIGKVIDVHGRVARCVPYSGMGIEFAQGNKRDIKLLLSAIRKIDQAHLMALSRAAFED
ncbi:MAG: PilZ domain-containing protein, partial [Desulfomonilia bacterium]|nr:PilZ domain-containing protein [Desulfomonilia bacterium]